MKVEILYFLHLKLYSLRQKVADEGQSEWLVCRIVKQVHYMACIGLFKQLGLTKANQPLHSAPKWSIDSTPFSLLSWHELWSTNEGGPKKKLGFYCNSAIFQISEFHCQEIYLCTKRNRSSKYCWVMTLFVLFRRDLAWAADALLPSKKLPGWDRERF